MIGRKLKVARVEAQMKQKDVAATVGISSTFLSLIENEKANPTKQVIELIMESIGVDVNFNRIEKK